ncbi:MAG: hypothetical protein H0V84_02670 [Actinobacteria bacterium]|nr:hypothetical protein [Actinomycetota bacterium]
MRAQADRSNRFAFDLVSDDYVQRDAAAGREELAASGLFAEPWWKVCARTLSYTPARFVSFLLTLSGVAAQPAEWRADLARALHDRLGERPLAVTDLVYVVAARRR